MDGNDGNDGNVFPLVTETLLVCTGDPTLEEIALRIERGVEVCCLMEFATIVAEPRSVLGKKVKRLRREGVLPGNVFGRGLESKALQMDAREFLRTVRAAGVRTMFKLTLNDESSPRYVFIRGLMREGGMGAPRHVDFYQVDLDQPIETTVPLKLTGVAPAVRDLAGILVANVERLKVRTLPLNIPDHVEADLDSLRAFDAVVTAESVKMPDGVELVDSPDMVLATVSPPRLRLEEDLSDDSL